MSGDCVAKHAITEVKLINVSMWTVPLWLKHLLSVLDRPRRKLPVITFIMQLYRVRSFYAYMYFPNIEVSIDDVIDNNHT